MDGYTMRLTSMVGGSGYIYIYSIYISIYNTDIDG